MSEAADKLCAAIQQKTEEYYQRILASVRVELSLKELMRLNAENKLHDKTFQDELVKKIKAVLHHLSPESRIDFPALQAGSLNCLSIIYTGSGMVKEGLEAYAFALPRKEPK